MLPLGWTRDWSSRGRPASHFHSPSCCNISVASSSPCQLICPVWMQKLEKIKDRARERMCENGCGPVRRSGRRVNLKRMKHTFTFKWIVSLPNSSFFFSFSSPSHSLHSFSHIILSLSLTLYLLRILTFSRAWTNETFHLLAGCKSQSTQSAFITIARVIDVHVKLCDS